MKVVAAPLPGLFLIEPHVHQDARGFFLERYNKRALAELIGFHEEFVQDNHSRSSKNVIRGLHYQLEEPQGKLVYVVKGEVFDTAVDLRRSSPTFGQWFGANLSEGNKRMLWIPDGFAHGFLVLSEIAEIFYKTTNYYHPQSERCLLWNDPDIAISWPIEASPILSKKDQEGSLWKSLKTFS